MDYSTRFIRLFARHISVGGKKRKIQKQPTVYAQQTALSLSIVSEPSSDKQRLGCGLPIMEHD